MESNTKMPHFKFKDIEIDGDLKSYCDKLEAKGFSFEYFTDDSEVGVLTGTFAGIDYCEIWVLYSKFINKVWKIVVNLPSQSSWSLLKNDYTFLKNICEKKYGNPESYEIFQLPYKEWDGKEMKAVENDMCVYSSYWKPDNGAISVNITSSNRVDITYENVINSSLISKARAAAAEQDV